MPVQQIEIKKIRLDGGTQQRVAGVDKDVVRRYAAQVRAGALFPPVRVYFDGTDYWLSDGFHRVEAHERAGRTDIAADVVPGTQRDAVWDSFSANGEHGLLRTAEDTRRLLYRIFADQAWKTKSQRAIAAHTKLGKSRVYEVLREYRRATGEDGPRAGPEPANKRRPAGDESAQARALGPVLSIAGEPSWRIIHGSALRSGLPDQSVQACITSPPYWLHRVFGGEPEVWGGDRSCSHVWEDASFVRKGSTNGRADVGSTLRSAGRGKVLGPGEVNTLGAAKDLCRVQNARCLRCGAQQCELGQEARPDRYVGHLVEVFREVWRVLRDDGTCWVNLGDTYIAETRGAGGKGKQHTNRGSVLADRGGRVPEGLRPKSLALVPFRFAFAMEAAGWYCRCIAPWIKPDSMPEPVKDRPGVAVEYWMMFTKRPDYFYDADAVKLGPAGDGRNRRNSDWWYESLASLASQAGPKGMVTSPVGLPLGLDFANTGYRGDHHATFPVRMIEPIVLASTSEVGCCQSCGTAMETVRHECGVTGARQRCPCPAGAPVPCTVFDPFTGVASTAVAALGLGRRFVGTEINADYVQQAHQRIAEWRERQVKRAG